VLNGVVMRRWVLVLALCACSSNRPDDTADDTPGDDGSECDPGCHWDCFGGAYCLGDTAWVNGSGARECCQYGDPWPDPGPACSIAGHECGGACIEPDPRYAACTQLLGTTADCSGADCEHLLLFCPEGAAKVVGASCASDADCRPAADGIARLRCDVGGTATCVVDGRPAPGAEYGMDCGFTDADFPGFEGERVVEFGACPLCQVARSAGGCLRQGCTQTCTFDEDCPDGSICLCGTFGSPVIGYCAAATDRETADGRAAGLAACP
jgi:hypothetical protein